MGKTINNVSNQPQPLDLETFANKKEPEQKQKEQPAPSGVSDAKWEETYAGMHDAPNIDWSQVHGNNADPTALAQQAGKAQQAKAKAPAKSIDVDMKNLSKDDKVFLAPSKTAKEHKEGSPYRANDFTVSEKKTVPRGSLPSRIVDNFPKGKEPIYQVDVSFPGSETDPKVRKQDTWYYDAESKKWGFFDDKSKFQTSNVGPYGRVIEKVEKDFIRDFGGQATKKKGPPDFIPDF